MQQKFDKNQKDDLATIIGFIILIAWIYIPVFLLTKELFLLAFLVVSGGTFWLIKTSKNVIKTNINGFFKERKKLKNLEYYFIFDSNKTFDLEKRRQIFNLFNNLTSGSITGFLINYVFFFLLINHWFGDSLILTITNLVFISFLIFFGGGGFIAGFVFKHMTFCYISIPFISAFIYFGSFASYLDLFPVFINLVLYLLITAFFYKVLAIALPVHALRNLNNQTVLISAILTIFAAFANQVFLVFFWSLSDSKDYYLTAQKVVETNEISDTFRSILLDNSELIDLINHFIDKELTSELSSVISLAVTGITLSFLIGGLIISRKVNKCKNHAKIEYRNMLMNPELIKYHSLVKCAFLGGETYENMILNTPQMKEIILENEKDIVFPDRSIKTKILNWLKNKSKLLKKF